jgi:hypothetical protein
MKCCFLLAKFILLIKTMTEGYPRMFFLLKRMPQDSWAWWYTPIIPDTWEVESGRLQSKARMSKGLKTLSQKKQNESKKGTCLACMRPWV